MKNTAILTIAVALLGVVALPQMAEAKHHHTNVYPAVVPNYYGGYVAPNYGYNGYGYNPPPSFGGATVFPDGSFSNNGVSWNGADPTGGATGIRRYGYRAVVRPRWGF